MDLLHCLTGVLVALSAIALLWFFLFYQVELGKFKNYLAQMEATNLENSRANLERLGDLFVVALFFCGGFGILFTILGLLIRLG